jgi:DNA-binding transcriptional regulator YhcF (GntR family)
LDRLEDLLLFWEHKLDEREDEMLMLKQHGSPCERRNAVRQLASKLAPERRELERAYERLEQAE